MASKVRSSDDPFDALRFRDLDGLDEDRSSFVDAALPEDTGVLSSASNSAPLRFLDLVGVLNGSG